MHTAVLLRSNPDLRMQWDQRLSHVMVDEYQDTNLAQYVILRHLCVDQPNLAATGDPDQSIYGWRGANAKNVSNLERDYPALRVVRLEDNYRSTPEILSTADFSDSAQCISQRKAVARDSRVGAVGSLGNFPIGPTGSGGYRLKKSRR